jgi:hypothetical protein
VRWQVSHARIVTKWLAGFGFAPDPLWQVAQLPAATPACVKFAGTHAVVRWHESHDASVARCRAGRPAAALPLWQLAQFPGSTPAWLMARARGEPS